jgi:hypothetical protein
VSGARRKSKRLPALGPPPRRPISHGAHFTQHLGRIEANGVGKVEKINHIDPPLPGLQARDPALLLAQKLGKTLLANRAGLALLNDKLNEASMPLVHPERLCGMRLSAKRLNNSLGVGAGAHQVI